MHFLTYLKCWWIAKRFPGYGPQPVTAETVMRWLDPYNPKEKKALLKYLKSIEYLNEGPTRQILLSLNAALLRWLSRSGIGPRDVVYIQVHDAGSSSPVFLNILKDYAHIQKLGCHLVDSKDAVGLASLFRKIEQGAVVYVDDFAGTGNQLCGVRDMLAPLIPTTFVEFVLMPVICEEAYGRFTMRGVEPYAGRIHAKADRPLHESSTILDSKTRSLIRDLCSHVVPPTGLGYQEIASHIVFYRNAPNTIPAVLRGSRGQKPYPGLFPRSDDFEPPDIGPVGTTTPKMKERLFKLKDEAAKQHPPNSPPGPEG